MIVWKPNSLHALDDCVNLVPSLCTFAFLAIEHHSMFDLNYRFCLSETDYLLTKVASNFVVQTTTFWIRKSNDDIFVFRFEVLANTSDSASRS